LKNSRHHGLLSLENNRGIHGVQLRLDVRGGVAAHVDVDGTHERLEIGVILTIDRVARLFLHLGHEGPVKVLAIEIGKKGVGQGRRKPPCSHYKLLIKK